MLPALSRRTLLRAGGIAMALPALEAMSPHGLFAAPMQPPQRMVCICTSLGLHAPFLYPQAPGRDYALTPYLELIKEHRADFTLFSGLSHPEQSGADGHSSERTWLTGAKHPGLGGFRNTISLDQLYAEKVGFVTRYPTLVMSTSGQTSQSYTRSGVMVPADSHPSQIFAKLFLEGTPDQVKKQLQQLRQGRSILDAVGAAAKRLEKQVPAGDKDKLAEYYQSVREMETRLAKGEEWTKQPKPKVEAEKPEDVKNESDLIARMKLLFDLVPLALQTDSTRAITILVQGRNDVPPVKGVTVDHHNLSHHGQDPEKIEQLKLIETELMNGLNGLLTSLKEKQEEGKRLLDSTMLLFGSNLGNANSHDWHNLPIVFAGGGFKHGEYCAFDAKQNLPLGNLLLTMLQKMGLELDAFATSTGTLSLG
jgi:Protein of unknown function (DUF1552)